MSEKMLDETRKRTLYKQVDYIHIPIEDFGYPANSFDAVISSLAFHYVRSFDDVCVKVKLPCRRRRFSFPLCLIAVTELDGVDISTHVNTI